MKKGGKNGIFTQKIKNGKIVKRMEKNFYKKETKMDFYQKRTLCFIDRKGQNKLLWLFLVIVLDYAKNRK